MTQKERPQNYQQNSADTRQPHPTAETRHCESRNYANNAPADVSTTSCTPPKEKHATKPPANALNELFGENHQP
jgi:hypothetical protein